MPRRFGWPPQAAGEEESGPGRCGSPHRARGLRPALLKQERRTYDYPKKIGVAVCAAALLVAAVTFIKVYSSNMSAAVEIRLAHNQQEGSEIADSIALFSVFVSQTETSL